MKSKYKALALLIIVLSLLTIVLKGAAPKTYTQTEIPASATQTTIVSYNLNSGANWSISDFATDANSWQKYDYNVNSSLYINDEKMCLTTAFGFTQGPQFTILSRPLDINISEFPIFSINISVSEGVFYHVRFIGRNYVGVERQVWWETSPLDDIPGKSNWEIHAVDLAAFSEQAIGEIIPELTLLQVVLDADSSQATGEKSLSISSIGFAERNLKITELSENAASFFENDPFQAVIINIPSQYMPEKSWTLQMASVTYSLTSNVSSGYRMYFLSRDKGLLIDGFPFISHEASFVDIYKLEALLDKGPSFFEQLTLVSSLLGNYSIVILKDELDQSGFLTFKLYSVEVASLKEIGEAAD
jgi:hypothetical protein